MESTKEHLAKVHTRLAQHQVRKVKSGQSLAAHFRKFRKAMEDDGVGNGQLRKHRQHSRRNECRRRRPRTIFLRLREVSVEW